MNFCRNVETNEKKIVEYRNIEVIVDVDFIILIVEISKKMMKNVDFC